jgi:hypothetical protein
VFSLKRQIFYLVLDLPDLLLSILKDEELFQFGSHVALKVLSERSGVNRAAYLAESIALKACSGLARTAIFSVKFTQRTVPLPST